MGDCGTGLDGSAAFSSVSVAISRAVRSGRNVCLFIGVFLGSAVVDEFQDSRVGRTDYFLSTTIVTFPGSASNRMGFALISIERPLVVIRKISSEPNGSVMVPGTGESTRSSNRLSSCFHSTLITLPLGRRVTRGHSTFRLQSREQKESYRSVAF